MKHAITVNGITYNSVFECAKALGINPTKIRDRLHRSHNKTDTTK